MRGHENHLAALQAMRFAGDADFDITFEHVDERIEGSRVLAQALTFVECEDGHGTGRLLDDFAADNRAVLVVHQLCGLRNFSAESSWFWLSGFFHSLLACSCSS